MKRFFSVMAICCGGFALWLVFKPAPSLNHAPEQAQQICTAVAPCIKLEDKAGKEVAKLNDFRFITGTGCIIYRLTLADRWQRYCGGHMVWIGPDPTQHTSLQ